MDLEIVERQNDVQYEIASVSFPAYEEYKEKATIIADYIKSMDVSEENIKGTKETLAKARKLTDRLDYLRIQMKKDILSNFTVFENQVKEIASIVDTADKEIREKVKILEEAEREKKKEAIKELWDKRLQAYPNLESYLPGAFERWLNPRHLNKTTSMSTIEKEMTEWMAETLADVGILVGMGDEYLTEYADNGNLARTIENVNRRKERTEKIRKIMDSDVEEHTSFIVYGKKDITLTEKLLDENKINYRKVEE